MNTPTTSNTLYRFRSIEALLDKYHELENQTIYFASPEELNDPMEGLRDIVWRGDRIVWTNLFKHYVYCMYVSCLQFRIIRDSVEFDVDNIPILGRWDQLATPQMQALFDDIWCRFLNLPKIPELIETLANTNRKIRYRELGLYLQAIHFILYDEIIESFIAHGFRHEPTILKPSERLSTVRKGLELIHALITQIEQDPDDEKINVAFQVTEEMRNERRIVLQLNSPNPTGILWKNIQLVVRDFPKIYLNKIERLLWPNWYTACFMKDYHNSSVWGYYGDKHEGACLIFESEKTEGSNGLELYQETGKSVRVIPFSEITYVDKPGEVDFFRSIGRITVEMLMKLWYTDAEGNTSKCAAHIPRDGEMDNDDTVTWRKNYWDSFYRDITAKTKDWKYEQECRLILEDGLRQFDKKKSRKLTYDFNSLIGIIFGIKTSEENRLRIVKIIQEKCKKHKRTDFKFYQAEYSPETGDIRKYEIQLACGGRRDLKETGASFE